MQQGLKALSFGLAILALAPAAAEAQNMIVYVNQGVSNTLVQGATVCVGTSDQPTRYGTKTTNSQGQAQFTNLPGSALLVTATKSGYAGQSRTTPATNYSRSVRFPLLPGSGGPTCTAPPLKMGGVLVPSTIEITSFSINNNAAETRSGVPVQLWATWKGVDPTHYRVSERANFSGARWETYQLSTGRPRRSQRPWRASYRFSDESPGRKTLFYQLRGAGGQTSKAMSDQINVAANATAAVAQSCRLEIQRADNALSNTASPALTEVVQIAAGQTRTFNSAWPSDNERRRGFGMHVRRLRNLGSLPMIVNSTMNLAPAAVFVLNPNESRSVRFDLDKVMCGGDE